MQHQKPILKQLEENAYATRVFNHTRFSDLPRFEGDGVILFELMGVPSLLMEQFLFTRTFIEVNDSIRTIESRRSFNSLPKWLKKRMKFRLNHPNMFFDKKQNVVVPTETKCIMGECTCHTSSQDFIQLVERMLQ